MPPSPDAAPGLEPDRARQEAWLDSFSRFALDHLEGLERAPAVGAVGAEGLAVAREVSVPLREEPLEGGVARVLSLLDRAVGASLGTAGPGYLAYVPGGGLYAAALADFVACCVNRYTGLAAAAPALCRLEADVLAWLARAFGYGQGAAGLLTSGGSMANFGAIVTARHHAFGDTDDLRGARAYASGQVHHSVAKSLRMAGVPTSGLATVAVDSRLRLDVADLERQVRADRAAGRRPFLVIASAGTTNTGAVDPLPALADLCARESLWLHADGAYGGAFVLCDEGRRRLAGIERADSVTFDPHKGLFLPYGTGCLLVREGALLRRAHHGGADYLQDFDAFERGGEPPSACEYGPELSRDYRGLRVWLPLVLHGARAFREALAEKLELARLFHRGLTRLAAGGLPLEAVDEPQSSTVGFRLTRRPGEPLAAWNARNAAFLAAINDRKRVYLSSTALPVEDGAAFTLRACILSFRTHRDRIEAALEDVAAAASS